MLVTVLHRLEDTPAAKADAAFPDVRRRRLVCRRGGLGQQERASSPAPAPASRPDGQITREQLATILYRYADFLGLDTSAAGALSQFSDGARFPPGPRRPCSGR